MWSTAAGVLTGAAAHRCLRHTGVPPDECKPGHCVAHVSSRAAPPLPLQAMGGLGEQAAAGPLRSLLEAARSGKSVSAQVRPAAAASGAAAEPTSQAGGAGGMWGNGGQMLAGLQSRLANLGN